jgi:4-amino-4-deoxy-L-arabinose transferase-like glycosyltransferase
MVVYILTSFYLSGRAMRLSTIADYLWGHKARIHYLMLASILLLFTFLGGREIWTQEHRWADIVSGMFFRNDFLHPYLGSADYYDKPLLSYWLIVFFSWVMKGLSTWTLRLPSALAGLLAVWSLYRLGRKIKDNSMGLLSGWLLLTTFYFVFWARTSSADMLNLAGSLFAISWYFDRREHAGFFDYSVFFIIIALTSLCKGLVGAIVPLIAVFIDIVMQKSWRQHFRLSLILSVIPGILVYLTPFIASAYYGNDSYGQNGLYLVYRENILRYFQPFDHQGPIYTYLIYLPVYLLPSIALFIPALFSLKSRWKNMSVDSKWIVATLAGLFLFFSLSGSRRSYYVLPMIPFAILLTSDWILSVSNLVAKKQRWTAGFITATFIILFAGIDLIPEWYYGELGVGRFASSLKVEANKIRPWEQWNVVVLDAESKLNFYLQLPPTVIRYHIKGSERHILLDENRLLSLWPSLNERQKNTIYLTRKLYEPILKNILVDCRKFEIKYSKIPFFEKDDMDTPIAYLSM